MILFSFSSYASARCCVSSKRQTPADASANSLRLSLKLQSKAKRTLRDSHGPHLCFAHCPCLSLLRETSQGQSRFCASSHLSRPELQEFDWFLQHVFDYCFLHIQTCFASWLMRMIQGGDVSASRVKDNNYTLLHWFLQFLPHVFFLALSVCMSLDGLNCLELPKTMIYLLMLFFFEKANSIMFLLLMFRYIFMCL